MLHIDMGTATLHSTNSPAAVGCSVRCDEAVFLLCRALCNAAADAEQLAAACWLSCSACQVQYKLSVSLFHIGYIM